MSPLLQRVISRLARVKVREQYITRGKGEVAVYGMLQGADDITINPVPGIVETVIHEVLHALNPKWSETTVERLTTRLFRELTEDEMRLIYGIYRERLR